MGNRRAISGEMQKQMMLKEIFDREIFRGELKFNEPLSHHTSLKIGGPADIMIFPEDVVSLKNALIAAKRENFPVFVIGAGTNILVKDGGVDGVVVSLREFKSIEIIRNMEKIAPHFPLNSNHEDFAALFVGAGRSLPALIDFTEESGFSGIEPLAGIPGSFGGAVYMNAGSFGVEIKDVIVSVALMKNNGEISILPKEDIKFSYRKSGLPDDAVIVSANIVLWKDSPENVSNRVKEFLKKKRETQPLGKHSAGCVFKNPSSGYAGRLIEEAGCKGMKRGGVEVSAVHANYFVGKKGASSKDFIELMEAVKKKVRDFCGITLEPEIKIVGRE